MAITILYFALPNLPAALAAFLLPGTGAPAPAGFCKIVTLTLFAIPPPTTPLGRGKLGGKLPRRAWATPRPGSTGGAWPLSVIALGDEADGDVAVDEDEGFGRWDGACVCDCDCE